MIVPVCFGRYIYNQFLFVGKNLNFFQQKLTDELLKVKKWK